MLPHRFPFRLIDRSLDAARAEVELSANGALLRGDAPMPLSLVIEIVAQASAYLSDAEEQGEDLRLAAVERGSLDRTVAAGDRLVVVISVERRYGRLMRVHGRIESDGAAVGEAILVLAAAANE